MEIIKDYVIPLLTFGLGVIFTMMWDKRKKIKDENNKATSRLNELTTEWFNQLYKLNAEKKFNVSNFEKEAFFYSQNRLVLPEYLKIIAFLQGQKKYSKLVKKAEDFLALVTNYEKNKEGKKRRKQTSTIKCRDFIASLMENIDDQKDADNLLQKLDSLLQEIAVESGNVQKS